MTLETPLERPVTCIIISKIVGCGEMTRQLADDLQGRKCIRHGVEAGYGAVVANLQSQQSANAIWEAGKYLAIKIVAPTEGRTRGINSARMP